MGIGVTTILLMSAVIAVFLFVRQMRLWYIMSHFPGPPAYPLIGSAYLFDRDPRGRFVLYDTCCASILQITSYIVDF